MMDLLRAAGWNVELAEHREPLPARILERYPWMPDDYREFAENTRLCSSANQSAWFLTARDFAGARRREPGWNEWELLSLSAAHDDEVEKQSIRAFWDDHLPVFQSLASGFAYLALERGTLKVVEGFEPEFEVPLDRAASVPEAMYLFATDHPTVADLVEDDPA